MLRSPALETTAAAPQLSIVLPAFNEEGNIERAVRHAAASAAAVVSRFEVVVVDDGSRDGTAAVLDRVAQEPALALVRIAHAKNRGYGAALRAGFAAARGDLVFYTDSDNQFDLGGLAAVMPLMADHDAVLGYRVGRQDPRLRRVVSGFFNRLAGAALGMKIRDLNCSFKLFRREVLQSLPLAADDFFIDTELVTRLHRAGHRYVEHGVPHFPRTSGRSTVRPGDVPKTLLSIARMWFALRFPGSATLPRPRT